MARSEVFKMDGSGLIVDGATIECATDLEAMARAARLLNNYAQIEVWTRAKRVGTLAANSPDRSDGGLA